MTRTLLRGATVITMSPGRPDAERTDILIDGDRVTGLGTDLDTRDTDNTDIVDLPGRIVIPGLVNAHLHSWQTALRSVGADWTLLGYLARVHGAVAPQVTPDDMRISTLAGALNQINCGTTTLGDWCHNTRTPEHVDAAVEGLRAAGIRAVFMHGTMHRAPDVPHPQSEIDRLLNGAFATPGLLRLGMAINGPQYSTPDVAVADCRAADERGLVVSMHYSGGEPAPAWEAVRDAAFLGPRTNVVHGTGLTDDWVKILVETGVSFTSTPENELGQGHGTPITGKLLRHGAAPSLGTDVDSVVRGDVLSAARIALAHQRALDHDNERQRTGMISATPSITSKQALAWATREGAKALGLADHVGRIDTGMQADLVAIDTRALNLWPARDPIATALHADLANIEAVMVAGQWRKRHHALVGVDEASIRDSLVRTTDRLHPLASG